MGKTSKAFQIKLAARRIEIHPLHEGVQSLCQDYIITNKPDPDFVIAVTEEDICRERMNAKLEDKKIGNNMSCDPVYLEFAALYRQIVRNMVLSYNTILIHGSVIDTAGLGYMITATSGTGKTTRTKLWTECIPNSCVVNGDKPLISITDSEVNAFGTPWSGKEGWNHNIVVPLRAIFLLERSEEENIVRETSFAEAFPQLLSQTYMPKDPEAKRKALHLLQKMCGKVKVYRFKSEPTEESVRLAWETARPMGFD